MLIRNFSVSIVLSTILLFTANAQVNHLVIGAVYGGGGNASATYKFDFIELYNPTAKSIILKRKLRIKTRWQALPKRLKMYHWAN